MFKAEPLTPSIGAVISGVSLNHLDSESLDQIYDSLIKHQVIFFEIKSFRLNLICISLKAWEK